MLSHDFARALLARRNHDLRFIVEVCMPGRPDEEDGEINRTRLADDRAREVYGTDKDVEILEYDSSDDMLDVMLGPIFAGEQGGYYLTREEAQLVRKALVDELHRIFQMANDKAAHERFSQLYKRMKDAR
jgi:hypothetical protein